MHKPRRIVIRSTFQVSLQDIRERSDAQYSERYAKEAYMLKRAHEWCNEHAAQSTWNVVIRPWYTTFACEEPNNIETGKYTLHGELWLIEHNFMVEPPRYFPPLDVESGQFDTHEEIIYV